MTDVVSAVNDVAAGLDYGVNEYHELREILGEYFKRGIVPSSIPIAGREGYKCPQPITVLNVAYRFYLENLDDLIKGIRHGNPLSIKHRHDWTNKLEMWAMKAIDDYLLMSKVKGV